MVAILHWTPPPNWGPRSIYIGYLAWCNRLQSQASVLAAYSLEKRNATAAAFIQVVYLHFKKIKQGETKCGLTISRFSAKSKLRDFLTKFTWTLEPNSRDKFETYYYKKL